jgi:HEAT repeat protein
MFRIHRHCSSALLVCALAFAASNSYASPDDQAMAPADTELKALYWRGHEALKRSDWNAALERFARLEQDLRRREPAAVDAAIYWQAYALSQAKRTAQVRSMVDRLHQEFPNSRWIADADALLPRAADAAAAPAASADAKAQPGGDPELAEVAVEALMQVPAERALPLLRKVIAGRHTQRTKQRALFVLSQMDDPAAIDLILDLARGNDGALRDEAIRMLAIGGQPRALEALSQIYSSSTDASARREVLSAWMIAGDQAKVAAAARSESDPEVRRQAIQLLGAMGANAELMALFDAHTDARTRRAIVQSLGVGGDRKALARIAASNADERTRIDALQALGVAGGKDELLAAYAQANSPALRDAVLSGLMISGDSKALVSLYRGAKTDEEKKAILRMLSVVDGDAALDIIESALER